MSTASLEDMTSPSSGHFMPRMICNVVHCCTERMTVEGFDSGLDRVRIASYLRTKRVKRAP